METIDIDKIAEKKDPDTNDCSTIGTNVAKAASHLFFFRTISQITSWLFTLLIARVLLPNDYGLLDMATIITGFAVMFNELGLGAAIVQRKEISEEELSSVFWLSACVSIVLAIVTYYLAYPTSLIFNEPRVIPLTQATSVIFVLSGLQIVPLNLLKRNISFKLIGFVGSVSVILSSVLTYVLARLGFGPWSLLLGQILRTLVTLILYSFYANWKPRFHFSLRQTKSYLSFGYKVMLANSFSYFYTRADRFFAGRIWSAGQLGLYGFAKELSYIPTERFVAVVNEVSFSGFAKLQDNSQKLRELYLTIVKYISIIILPFYVGGFLLGDELIVLILDEKWHPMNGIFRALCLIQIVICLNSINNFVHTSQGRPGWTLFYTGVLAVTMPLSFIFMLSQSLSSVLIPWFTTFAIINLMWILLSIRKLGIPLLKYMACIFHPLIGCTIMGGVVFLSDITLRSMESYATVALLVKVALGALTYLAYCWLFAKKDLQKSLKLIGFKTGKKR